MATDPLLTPIQNIALSFAFAVLGESQVNRTHDEYMAIASKMEKMGLKRLLHKINCALKELHKCDGCGGAGLPEILRFKAGDTLFVCEPYPTAISYETLRAALTNAGMRSSRTAKAA